MIPSVHPWLTCLWLLTLAPQLWLLVVLTRPRATPRNSQLLAAYALVSMWQTLVLLVDAEWLSFLDYDLLDFGSGWVLCALAVALGVRIVASVVRRDTLYVNWWLIYLELTLVVLVTLATARFHVIEWYRTLDQVVQLWTFGIFIVIALFARLTGSALVVVRGFFGFYCGQFLLACAELWLPAWLTPAREVSWAASMLLNLALFAYWGFKLRGVSDVA